MKELNAKQCQAISLLAQGFKGAEIAKELDIAPQTLSQWKRLEQFSMELNRLRYESITVAIDSLQCSSNTAVQTFRDIYGAL